MRVIVRLRPEEQEGGALAGGKDMAGSCIQCVDDKKLTVVDPRRRSSGGGGGISVAGGGGKRGEDQHQRQQAHDFTFDRVFGPEATQDDVFDTVKPLVHATVDGELGSLKVVGVRGGGGVREHVRWARTSLPNYRAKSENFRKGVGSVEDPKLVDRKQPRRLARALYCSGHYSDIPADTLLYLPRTTSFLGLFVYIP